jgi:hypothetical protein
VEALFVLGKAKVGLGQVDNGLSMLRRAAEAADLGGYHRFAAESFLELAEVLQSRRESARGSAAIAEAYAINDRLRASEEATREQASVVRARLAVGRSAQCFLTHVGNALRRRTSRGRWNGFWSRKRATSETPLLTGTFRHYCLKMAGYIGVSVCDRSGLVRRTMQINFTIVVTKLHPVFTYDADADAITL